jgi:hypothetical protein
MPVSVKEQAEAFHAHLDVCKQCANHPFDLCLTGQEIMRRFLPEPRRPLRPLDRDDE